VDSAKLDRVPIVDSAFKAIGFITINRHNSLTTAAVNGLQQTTRYPIDRFDYHSSPSEDYALVNAELEFFGPHEETNSLKFCTKIRPFDAARGSSKRLHIPRFKFSKC